MGWNAEKIWERKNEIGAVAVVVFAALFLVYIKLGGASGYEAVATLDNIRQTSEGKVYELVVREHPDGKRLFHAELGPTLSKKTEPIKSKKKSYDAYFRVYWKYGSKANEKVIISVGGNIGT